MRLDDESESSNYEIRRGGGGFGLPMGIPLGRGGLGCGSLIVILIISMVLGVNPLSLLGDSQQGAPVTERSEPGEAPGGKTPVMVRSLKVLGSTERVWSSLFSAQGKEYRPATLVFYEGGTQAGCGFASASAGPFYCPADQRIFLDTSFFDELSSRHGAPGDFAQAYVIAHEVGHHIQDLDGTLARVRAEQDRVGERAANALQVKVELQADCYAGIWAANDQNLLEPGDAEAGMRAAAAVGDDTLQKATQGRVVPEGFTHGSAAERQKWLRIGLTSGDPARCDTFGGR